MPRKTKLDLLREEVAKCEERLRQERQEQEKLSAEMEAERAALDERLREADATEKAARLAVGRRHNWLAEDASVHPDFIKRVAAACGWTSERSGELCASNLGGVFRSLDPIRRAANEYIRVRTAQDPAVKIAMDAHRRLCDELFRMSRRHGGARDPLYRAEKALKDARYKLSAAEEVKAARPKLRAVPGEEERRRAAEEKAFAEHKRVARAKLGDIAAGLVNLEEEPPAGEVAS